GLAGRAVTHHGADDFSADFGDQAGVAEVAGKHQIEVRRVQLQRACVTYQLPDGGAILGGSAAEADVWRLFRGFGHGRSCNEGVISSGGLSPGAQLRETIDESGRRPAVAAT